MDGGGVAMLLEGERDLFLDIFFFDVTRIQKTRVSLRPCKISANDGVGFWWNVAGHNQGRVL